MFQGCFKEFSRKLSFHESMESVTRVFHWSLKCVSRKFQRWLSQVLGVLQKCFKEMSRKLTRVLNASIMLHDCFKVGSSMFCVFFKVVWIIMGVSWMFKGCFTRVLTKFRGNFKSASKVVERKFQKCSKDVSRLFQGNFNNVSKVFQSGLKGVSRMFCFLILHGTHRSYPSRRRVCSPRKGKIFKQLFCSYISDTYKFCSEWCVNPPLHLGPNGYICSANPAGERDLAWASALQSVAVPFPLFPFFFFSQIG